MVSKSDRRLLTKDKLFVIPNFAEEAEMLEWAGISFGEENTLRLQKSIKVSSFNTLFKKLILFSSTIESRNTLLDMKISVALWPHIIVAAVC